MDDNVQILIQRIDNLIQKCERDFKAYNKVLFEAKQLIISIAGETSPEAEQLRNLNYSKESIYVKLDCLQSVLGALRNRIIIDGIKSTCNYNWDECLHPIIYKTSFKKMQDGYYSDAVESAIKEINFRLKNLYKKHKGKELDGSDLFANVFNNDNNKTLLIAGKDLFSQSGKDEQEGYRLLFMGLWKGIRNPKAHENTTLTKLEAIQRLTFVSMLMYKIDNCINNSNLIE